VSIKIVVLSSFVSKEEQPQGSGSSGNIILNSSPSKSEIVGRVKMIEVGAVITSSKELIPRRTSNGAWSLAKSGAVFSGSEIITLSF